MQGMLLSAVFYNKIITSTKKDYHRSVFLSLFSYITAEYQLLQIGTFGAERVKVKKKLSEHMNNYFKEESVRLGFYNKEQCLSIYASSLTVHNYAIFIYPFLCLTPGKIYLLLVLDCN